MSSTTSWTRPQAADVILYSYLWRHEAASGEESGRKDRPCLVLSVRKTRAGLRVITAPITTKHHEPEQLAVLPPRVAHHLGLERACGVVCNDVNVFTWVGADVRTRPDGRPYFGQMPGRLVEDIIARAIANAVKATNRDDK